MQLGACSVLTLGLLLPWLCQAAAQDPPIDLQRRKAELEIQKLELEIEGLRDERGNWVTWATGIGGLAVGIGATLVSVWTVRRTQHGALDQSVHDKRLELYPGLVDATAPLAVYFPNGNLSASTIDQNQCRGIGHAMSEWYFAGGGLLMSVETRNVYFRLARALTRASLTDNLQVPSFPQNAAEISVEKLDVYREEIGREQNLDDVETWRFGNAGSDRDTPAHRFKDFVFLQRLSSTLRTKLSEDLRSRNRPS